MLRPFEPKQDENGDKVALYPKQIRPEGYVPPERPKLIRPKGKISLGDLVRQNGANEDRPKAGLSAALAAYSNARKAAEANGESGVGAGIRRMSAFMTHWKATTEAKAAHDQTFQSRVNAILKHAEVEGFKQAKMTHNWKYKSIWLVLALFMVAVMLYEIIQCVLAYQNSPVNSQYTLLTPDSMSFPLVYLCYGSAVNRSYIQNHKDEMVIAKVYQDRAAVTKKGPKRRKRDLSEMMKAVDGAEGLVRAIRRAADTMEESEWEMDEENEEMRMRRDEEEQILLELERIRRDVQTGGNFSSGGINSTLDQKSNGTMENKTKLAQAALAAKQARIDAIMNNTNISDIVYEYLEESAFKVDETFLECEFNTYTTQKLNCSDIVTPIIDANYGMCWLVNLPDHLNQTVAGQGLRILMNSQIGLYPLQSEGGPHYGGIFVSINHYFDQFNWLKSLASPGRLTKVDLEAHYVELMNLRSGSLIQPCVDEETAQAQLKVFGGNYSRTLCQMDCLFQAHRNLCKCIMPVDKSILRPEVLNDTIFCGPIQYKGCLANSADQADELVRDCRDQCHTPCKSYRYEMRTSSAKLFPPSFSRLSLPPNVTAKQLIELRVAFNRKEIIQLIQGPSMQFSDLVSNVGGQINLWMNASMIVLIEMFFTLFCFIIWRVYMRINRSYKLNKIRKQERR